MSLSVRVNGADIDLDDHGFLIDFNRWNKHVAEAIANEEGITLTEAHYEIIMVLRQFYETFSIAPNQRPFVKYIAKTLGPKKGASIYLLKLFPDSPAKRAARIAGLPKPSHCF